MAAFPEPAPLSPENQACFDEIEALAERGRYAQAWTLADSFWGGVRRWKCPRRWLLGSRLARHLGMPRLAQSLVLRSHRMARDWPLARYQKVLDMFERKGPFKALREFDRVGDVLTDDPALQSRWLALKARILSRFGDHVAAQMWLDSAQGMAPDPALLTPEMVDILVHQRRYDEALTALENLPASTEERLLCHRFRARIYALQMDARESMNLLDDLLEVHQAADMALTQGDLAVQNMRVDMVDAVSSRLAQWAPEGESEVVETLAAWSERSSNADGRRVLLDVPHVWVHELSPGAYVARVISRYFSSILDYESFPVQGNGRDKDLYEERRWLVNHGWHVREFSPNRHDVLALIDAGVPVQLICFDAERSIRHVVMGYDQRFDVCLLREACTPELKEWSFADMDVRGSVEVSRCVVMVPPEKINDLPMLGLSGADHYDRFFAMQDALWNEQHAHAKALLDEMAANEQSSAFYFMGLQALATETGDHHALVAELASELADDQDDPNLVWQQYRALEASGRSIEAVALLQRCRERGVAHVSLLQALARCSIDLDHEQQKTLDLVSDILCEHPRSSVALWLLASVLARNQEDRQASEYYRLALAGDDVQPEYVDSYLKHELLRGSEKEAISYLQKSYEEAREKSGGYAQNKELDAYFRSLSWSGDVGAIEAAAFGVFSSEETSFSQLECCAEHLLEAGSGDVLERIVNEVAPRLDAAQLLLIKGKIARHQDQPELAVVHFQKVLEAQPANEKLWNELLDVMVPSHTEDDVLRLVEGQHLPANLREKLIRNIGIRFKRKAELIEGEFRRLDDETAKLPPFSSLEEADLAVARDPQSATHLLRRSELRKAAGDDEGELQDVLLAARLEPFQADISEHLAGSYMRRGRFLEAGETIDGAIRKHPANMQLHVAKARIRCAGGETEAALGELEKCIVSHRDDDVLWADFVDVCSENERKNEAGRFAFEHAVSQPDTLHLWQRCIDLAASPVARMEICQQAFDKSRQGVSVLMNVCDRMLKESGLEKAGAALRDACSTLGKKALETTAGIHFLFRSGARFRAMSELKRMLEDEENAWIVWQLLQSWFHEGRLHSSGENPFSVAETLQNDLQAGKFQEAAWRMDLLDRMVNDNDVWSALVAQAQWLDPSRDLLRHFIASCRHRLSGHGGGWNFLVEAACARQDWGGLRELSRHVGSDAGQSARAIYLCSLAWRLAEDWTRAAALVLKAVESPADISLQHINVWLAVDSWLGEHSRRPDKWPVLSAEISGPEAAMHKREALLAALFRVLADTSEQQFANDPAAVGEKIAMAIQSYGDIRRDPLVRFAMQKVMVRLQERIQVSWWKRTWWQGKLLEVLQ